MKIQLGVIFGGDTVEHEVSIITAVQAMEHMDQDKYDIIPIYISKDRTWYTGKMLMDIDVYKNFTCLKPSNISSFLTSHETDNYFYDETTKKHYLIELKAGGDLDNKKSKAEKIALLNEYFILKNSLTNDEDISIFLATAYNKYGEDNPWKQERVRQYFADEELLIGKNYWNFVCKDDKGFDIIIDQYKISANYIKESLNMLRIEYKAGYEHIKSICKIQTFSAF